MDQIQKISNELGKLAASSKVATLDTNSTSDTCPIMMLQYGYTSAGIKLIICGTAPVIPTIAPTN